MDSSNLATLLAPALAGVAFHGASQLIRLDTIVPQTLGFLTAVAFAIFYVDVQIYHATTGHAAKTLTTSAASFFISLTACTLIYRVFFHRLRKFPGPLPAKLSRFYAVYLSRNLQYHVEVEKMHRKYGDVVRMGPRELSVARLSAIKPLSNCGKSEFYEMSEARKDRASVAFTTDVEGHRKRRRPWQMAMSKQQLSKYDAPMQSLISLFLDRMSAPERLGKPVDITQWIMWLSYDIMGVVGFGTDFGNLRTSTEHPAVQSLHDAAQFTGYLKSVPWLVHFLGHLPGCDGTLGPFADHARSLVREKLKNLSSEKLTAPADIITWLIRAFEEKGPSAAPTLAALDDDSRALVLAGSDTSSATLTIALYYLCAYPHIYTHLQSSLNILFPAGAASFSSATLESNVASVPLLDAIITETLRLQPAVPSGQPRKTPHEGLRVDDDLWLPGDTVVLVPQRVVQRDERYFGRAEEFVPERWVAGSGEEGLVRERGAWFPFQIGMWNCVGEKLAMKEMRSVLARIALQFDVEFTPGDDGKTFVDGIMDTWTLTLPPLNLIFTKRRARAA